MAIVHIVQFKFSSTTDADTISTVCSRYLTLKEKCIHPTSGKPYIMNMTGGKNNSPEGRNDGLTHAFVMIFDNEEDRNHYVHKDQEHQDFVAYAIPLLEKAVVVDYEPNAF